MMLRLADNETHLWWAFPDRIRDSALLSRQHLTLSPEEQDRHRRFVFENHRHRYLVSHALVRDVLSQYAPVAPCDWIFEANAYGRPEIAAPREWRWLRFNLSHSGERAVVAVARQIDLGVDVESVSTRDGLTDIANRFFSPLEVAQLRSAPDLFFDFWTLKEAYIKARGMGLSIPLDTFSFCLANPSSPQIAFHAGCSDQAGRWQFLLRRSGDHRLAVAAALGPGARLQVTDREIVPLA
jgi:4'-phosphopantetheinyl transferase